MTLMVFEITEGSTSLGGGQILLPSGGLPCVDLHPLVFNVCLDRGPLSGVGGGENAICTFFHLKCPSDPSVVF